MNLRCILIRILDIVKSCCDFASNFRNPYRPIGKSYHLLIPSIVFNNCGFSRLLNPSAMMFLRRSIVRGPGMLYPADKDKNPQAMKIRPSRKLRTVISCIYSKKRILMVVRSKDGLEPPQFVQTPSNGFTSLYIQPETSSST